MPPEYPSHELPTPLTTTYLECERRYKELERRSQRNQYLIKLYHIKRWVTTEIALRETELEVE